MIERKVTPETGYGARVTGAVRYRLTEVRMPGHEGSVSVIFKTTRQAVATLMTQAELQQLISDLQTFVVEDARTKGRPPA